MHRTKLLVCDLDNTLYDWVGYFVPSFNAMVDAAVRIMDCDRNALLDDLRAVHQEHNDSEHPFALLETATVRRHFLDTPTRDVAAALDEAFHAFNSTRKRTLHLNPGVPETIKALRASGILLVAHTESKLYSAYDRLARLELLDSFHRVYCRERSNSLHPRPSAGAVWSRRMPMDKITELSSWESKPNPAVLKDICARERVPLRDAAYVGDSLSHDVLMAKEAGVFSIWAEYGTRHDPELYKDLVRVSHWTEKRILEERELAARAKQIRPDFTASSSFREVLQALLVD